MKKIEGFLCSKELKFGIIISRFNDFITQKLLDGALDCIIRHGGDDSNITIIWVPGAFELSMAAKKIAKTEKFDAIICLGAIIRGDTPHFEYIASETAKGIAYVGFDSKYPVTFGVLTTDTLEQAMERSGSKAGNKGWDAALSAIEMADLYRKLQE
jgi:6,7-dimethyl-8-ribityllumazine synthase